MPFEFWFSCTFYGILKNIGRYHFQIEHSKKLKITVMSSIQWNMSASIFELFGER